MCSAVYTDVRLKQAVPLFCYQDTIHSNWLHAHPQLDISLGRHFMPTQLDHAGGSMIMHRLTCFTCTPPSPALPVYTSTYEMPFSQKERGTRGKHRCKASPRSKQVGHMYGLWQVQWLHGCGQEGHSQKVCG